MTDEDRIDAALTAMLATPERAPDDTFIARVERAVLAERKMAAARRAAWRRFAVETIASGAIVAAFYLLWRLSPELTLDQLPVAPSAAAILVLFLWLGVEMRQPVPSR